MIYIRIMKIYQSKKIKYEEPCPNKDNHTEWPEGYMQRHHRAECMVTTHKQSKCPWCWLYQIRTKREKPYKRIKIY